MPRNAPAEALRCLFELVFTIEWATLGFGVMLMMEVFANITVLIGVVAEVVLMDSTWDDAWEKYGYEPGDSMQLWAETLAKKYRELC